jgi:LuxR family transcriptional regulator, maltose regulon positive regulatory protein
VLLDRLREQQTVPVVTIFAPAGYGKSTLLAQVAASDERPLSLISLEEADNDPKVLVVHLAEALDRIASVPAAVLDKLRRAGTSLSSTSVPLLGAAWASIERPALLAIDDLHLLSERDSLHVVAAMCGYVPQGSQLMLAGREEPPLQIARIRAERRLTELGRKDLALDAAEAGALLSAAGVELSEQDVTKLTSQTEGWAAGLYLIALSLRDGGDLDRDEISAPAGPDHYIADYLRLEILSRSTPGEVEFLTRTAVLERMCGPLCDAILERTGSAAMLEELARSNQFLVPLDHRREWYRYHHLFRDMLLHELELREPGVMPILTRRAADWCEQHGLPEGALEYAFAGEEFERAAQLVMACAVPAYQSGRLQTARKWVARLEEAHLLERYPAIAVLGVWGAGAGGDPVEAERLAAIAERSSSEEQPPDGSPTIEPWVRAIRAQMCRHGVEQMRGDAERARELAPTWSFVQSVAALAHGMAFVLAGDNDQADRVLAEAAEVSEHLGQNGQLSFAVAERSLLATAKGDSASADRLAQEAQRIVLDADLEEYMTSAATYVALGKTAQHNRDLPSAEEHFASANRLRPRVTYFLPYLAVQTRLELAVAHVANGDPGGGRILLGEVDQLLRRTPELGVLVEQANELRRQIDEMRELGGDSTPLLTEAELRVLPLLATHLTFAEIAQRNYVSRATIKTQAISIYRKLDATKRSEAVARGVELGLIDSAAMPQARDFDLSG